MTKKNLYHPDNYTSVEDLDCDVEFLNNDADYLEREAEKYRAKGGTWYADLAVTVSQNAQHSRSLAQALIAHRPTLAGSTDATH